MLARHGSPATFARLAILATCLLVSARANSPGRATAAETAAPPPLELSPEIEARCLGILRGALKSDEFWPSMHAAEALTLAGHGDEVRAALDPHLPDRIRTGLPQA